MTPLREGGSRLRFGKLFSLPPVSPLWDNYGLSARASSAAESHREPRSRFASLPRPNRFRLALEQSGGLFPLFGEFLSGRADLLPGPYLAQLRSIRIRRDSPFSPSSLPEIRDRIVQSEWIRSAPCSEIYAATHHGRQIIVEVFLPEDAYSDGEFQELERQLRLLRNSAEAPAATPRVIEQFREWLRLQADVERKRAMLRTLEEIPFPCVSRFPRAVSELQSTRCLVYEREQGVGLCEALEDPQAAEQALDQWAEAILEQPLLLSLLDADAQPSNYLLLEGGRVGFRALPALAPVPVEWHTELLQYLSSAIAGNSYRAMQMLSRICAGASPYRAEKLLLEQLSALQPELRIHSSAAESVVALQNYWRALGQSRLPGPLFLHLFHRNLSVLGQRGPAEGPARDVISESLWPVLGRLLQFRLGETLSGEKGQEWLASSGMLLLTAARQSLVMLEQLRDNDLALEMEPEQDRDTGGNRRVAAVIHSGIGLMLFLFSLRMAQQTAGVLEWAALAAAAVLALVVFILVARIE